MYSQFNSTPPASNITKIGVSIFGERTSLPTSPSFRRPTVRPINPLPNTTKTPALPAIKNVVKVPKSSPKSK